MEKRPVKVHLVSMPWAMPQMPSIQTGTLKAFLDRHFGSAVKTEIYAPHFIIPYQTANVSMLKFYDEMRQHKEEPYFTLYQGSKKQKRNPPLSDDIIRRLKVTTENWIDHDFIPRLDRAGLNLIGFTLNYDQLYSSLFAARCILKRAEGVSVKFVFGGYGASLSHVQSAIRELDSESFFVLGEGEKRLCELVENLRHDRPTEPSDAAGRGQIENLEELPLPNFVEYFEKFRQVEVQDSFFSRMASLQKMPALALEGSRGCFAKCDFCAENAQWSGFRKMRSDVIFARTQEAIDKYKCRTIHFLDNISDPWAEGFADLALQKKEDLAIICMELRAHHPEIFWSKLKRAGVYSIQVGIEAVSSGLLKQINKGTQVIQNLAALKYLGELEIVSLSNLMTHHPKSTNEDIVESIRVMSLIPHFPKLRIVRFQLRQGSPIFDSIPEEIRKTLRPLQLGAMQYDFELPESYKLDPHISEEWTRFGNWVKDDLYGEEQELVVSKTSSKGFLELEVKDTRHRRKIKYNLRGSEAMILDSCHSICRRPFLEKGLGLSVSEMEIGLQSLIKKELLIEVDGAFLALPFRPKEELLAKVILTPRDFRLADREQMKESASQGFQI